MKNFEVVILGAGPAGLAAGLELVNQGVRDILIIDKNSRVGGLSRTKVFQGNRFDIGPHRFFTKNAEINRIWHDTLGDDFKLVNRLTRIFYKGHFFNYPLRPVNALLGMGMIEATHAMFSYLYAAAYLRSKEARNFEEWVTQKFGGKLYHTFFKTYTEKVWGSDCKRIGADWAAQRIKGMNLTTAIKNALFGQRGQKIKTLVEQFNYPKLGAGMMYEAIAERISEHGAEFRLNTEVKKISHNGERITSLVIKDKAGDEYEVRPSVLFSSIPITDLIAQLDSPAPQNVCEASESLYYRDHITVNLVINGDNLFTDQWIYVHSADVKMARLANYNNFSLHMPAKKGVSVVSVEYFVFINDEIWNLSDKDLIDLAVEELAYMKLIDSSMVDAGFVVRETKSYPTYYMGFSEPYDTVRKYISQFSNLYAIGRGGMYKYNNQDHSMYTGILAVRNYKGAKYDLWSVNIDAEYLEEIRNE